MIEPGEIFIADLDSTGRRPVIVVFRVELNRGQYALVVVCTSAHFARRTRLPNCVPFKVGQFGFASDCVAQCEYALTVERSQLDLANGPIGKLDDSARRDLIRAIAHVIEADCEPL